MSSLQDRFKDFMESKGLSPLQLAEELGVQRSSISHILNGRNKPSLDFLNKLITAYPDIDIHLLISGTEQQLQPDLFSETASSDSRAETLQSSASETPAPDPNFDTNVTSEQEVDDTNVAASSMRGFTNVTGESMNGDTFVTSPAASDEQVKAISELNENETVTKKLKKVILLYTDGSFEEYNS